MVRIMDYTQEQINAYNNNIYKIFRKVKRSYRDSVLILARNNTKYKSPNFIVAYDNYENLVKDPILYSTLQAHYFAISAMGSSAQIALKFDGGSRSLRMAHQYQNIYFRTKKMLLRKYKHIPEVREAVTTIRAKANEFKMLAIAEDRFGSYNRRYQESTRDDPRI